MLLAQGYWASYNVPYFPAIYNATGYPQPSIYSTCPRARIFAREQGGVASASDMKALMRLNRYREDPESLGTPNNAIAARYDLEGTTAAGKEWTRRAYGAVDAKVVDMQAFRERSTHVVCGPTTDDQPPFSWSDPAFTAISHEGCADDFSFDWQEYQPVMAFDAQRLQLQVGLGQGRPLETL